MSSNHLRFLARTVIVEGGNVDAAFQKLERMINVEKIVKDIRLRQYREKPYQERSRLAFERCKRVYNEEQRKRIEFLAQKTRPDPHLV